MKKFEIPEQYHSGIIGEIKMRRRISDPRKQDFTPSILDFGSVEFIIPRHFGFCYGVENAIEKSYKAIRENPGKNLFLLSQMIHNPAVNEDLVANGIRFILDTEGNQLVAWDEITKDDIVIIPAFGTTVETENLLASKGIITETYNTTCPFVEKVWKRSSEIGNKGFTIIIHGKYLHEETRATFSHSYQNAPSIIIRDITEAKHVGRFMKNEITSSELQLLFKNKFSAGFDPEKDLQRIGVVNQTTMLASETQEISDYFREILQSKHGENYRQYFADTRDTLCYATNDNQQSTKQVLDHQADLAIVVGGYNSSNTSQIANILSEKMPAYFLSGPEEIISPSEIRHFKYNSQENLTTTNWVPNKNKIRIVLTSGASCPDVVLESVMKRILEIISPEKTLEEVLAGH